MHSLAVEYASASVAAESLAVLRAAGRGCVRRRLEVLVNAGLLGVAGAQKVYRDAFGGELKAIKAAKASGWVPRIAAAVGWTGDRNGMTMDRARLTHATTGRVAMKSAIIAIIVSAVFLFPACDENGAGISRTTTPDAAWNEEVAVLAAPDTQPASVDVMPSPGPEAQPDTQPAPDLVAAGPEVPQVPDTSPDTQPVVPDAEVRRDTGIVVSPPDTTPNLPAWLSCAYQTQQVEVAKAGTYCGQYPKQGPQGTITCYTGCTVESTLGMVGGVATITPVSGSHAPDTNANGVCTAQIDDYQSSGSKTTRNGLCFDTAATCSAGCK